MRTLSARDYQLSEQHKKDPHILPINKNQFLRLLKQSIENNEVTLSLTDQAQVLIKKIKSEKAVGEYGRFSSYITTAEIIDCGRTIVYCPTDKNDNVIPDKKFVDAKSKSVNVLATVMGGCPELWEDYIDDQHLAHDIKDFYNQNKLVLDKILQDYSFIDRYNAFFMQDRMIDFTLSMPANKMQKLTVFDANTSYFRGGQWMFAAPSGVPLKGYVDKIVKKNAFIARTLDYCLTAGKYPQSFFATDVKTQKLVSKIKEPAKLLKRTQSLTQLNSKTTDSKSLKRSQSTPNLFDFSKPNKIPGKRFAEQLQIDTDAAFPMSERGEIVFLLACELNSNRMVFQNPRGNQSFPIHYHTYALNADTLFAEEKGNVVPVPLFTSPTEKTLFEQEIDEVSVKFEKLDWPAPCYRLVVPIQKDTQKYLAIAEYIQRLQTEILSQKKHCTISNMARKTENAVEFYLGFRAVQAQNPAPNKIATANNLQIPMNGTAEFIGMILALNKNEFNKYKMLYQENPEKAKKLFNEIRVCSLAQLKPTDNDVEDFEKCAVAMLPNPIYSLSNTCS